MFHYKMIYINLLLQCRDIQGGNETFVYIFKSLIVWIVGVLSSLSLGTNYDIHSTQIVKTKENKV